MFCPPRLTFRTRAGTTSCGGPALSPPAEAPFSGALFASGTKVADLGLGCLYSGGGSSTILAAQRVPAEAAMTFDATCIDPGTITLSASAGSSRNDCTRGPAATKHCANDTTIACQADADCPFTVASRPCQPDPRCFFGAPVPAPNPFIPALSTCIVHGVSADAAGTADRASGQITLTSYGLASRLYITGDADSPCPRCTEGVCDAGAAIGRSCLAGGPDGTSLDCPPAEIDYLGTMNLQLGPLTTGARAAISSNGLFCPTPFCGNGSGQCDPADENACNGVGVCQGQNTPGAFGVDAREIAEIGSPAGALVDEGPHGAVLVSTSCVSPPGEPISSANDLPGPAAISLPGTVQLGPVQGCPANPAGGPNELRFEVTGPGDLDVGWTGLGHDTPNVAGTSLRMCLKDCDAMSTQACAEDEAATNLVNGDTFGGPVPMLVANVPVCLVNRFDSLKVTSGSVDFAASGPPRLAMTVNVLSDTYLTQSPDVCPVCSGQNLGDAGTCDAKSSSPGAPCVVDGIVTLGALNRRFALSSSCRPAATLVGTAAIPLRLTTDAASLLGAPKPCGEVADDGCGSSGPCNAACVGPTTCPATDAAGRCIDARGGIAQTCCAGNPNLSCHPTAAASGIGTLLRTGAITVPKPAVPDPSFPKCGTATLASVFCEPATLSNLVNTVDGLPGPAAALLPVTWGVKRTGDTDCP